MSELTDRLREFGDIDSEREWRYISAKAANEIERLERVNAALVEAAEALCKSAQRAIDLAATPEEPKP